MHVKNQSINVERKVFDLCAISHSVLSLGIETVKVNYTAKFDDLIDITCQPDMPKSFINFFIGFVYAEGVDMTNRRGTGEFCFNLKEKTITLTEFLPFSGASSVNWDFSKPTQSKYKWLEYIASKFDDIKGYLKTEAFKRNDSVEFDINLILSHIQRILNNYSNKNTMTDLNLSEAELDTLVALDFHEVSVSYSSSNSMDERYICKSDIPFEFKEAFIDFVESAQPQEWYLNEGVEGYYIFDLIDQTVTIYNNELIPYSFTSTVSFDGEKKFTDITTECLKDRVERLIDSIESIDIAFLKALVSKLNHTSNKEHADQLAIELESTLKEILYDLSIVHSF
jgi:hypothetical protein